MSEVAQAVVAARLGLDFPGRRRDDLERALEAAGPEALRAPVHSAAWQRLVGALTVQESFFFRDGGVFRALREHVLPELIASREREGRRFLRLWSAGCADGQEPYSLAMVLDRLLAPGWDIAIAAGDVDAAALERARRGVYGEWALRETPSWARELYFRRGPDGYELAREIRERVSFGALNLHTDAYPPAIDVLLCRNVLMYFTPEAREDALRRLRGALAPGGWLIVGPAEASAEPLAPLRRVVLGDSILYRAPRSDEPAVATAARRGAAPDPATGGGAPAGREAASSGGLAAGGAPSPLVAARAEADAGRLDAAAELCRRALQADKLDVDAQLLLAAVERERGDEAAAIAALRSALFLAPDSGTAHFQLGSLLLRRRDAATARAHFDAAASLLDPADPDTERVLAVMEPHRD